MKRLTGLMRRCMTEYEMIKTGDKVAVGLSGGKDSVALLYALVALSHYYPAKFTVEAVTVDMGFGMDYGSMEKFCCELGVEYTIVPTNIQEIVFHARKESNPCSLCANLRRGALVNTATERGCSVLALGHNKNDAVETMMMALIYEGRLSCFEPKTRLERAGISVIRPMIYAGEQMTENVVRKYNLPVVKNRCPADGRTKRQEMKELLGELDARFPGIVDRMLGSMRRLPLPGWNVHEHESKMGGKD